MAAASVQERRPNIRKSCRTTGGNDSSNRLNEVNEVHSLRLQQEMFYFNHLFSVRKSDASDYAASIGTAFAI
jgi:hypothetical protein